MEIMKKTMGASALTLAVSLAMSTTVFSAPPFDDIPEGMDQSTYDALYDGVVEWSELEDLIRYRNPTYTYYYDEASGTLDQLQSAISSDIFEYRSQLAEADDALDALYETQKQLQSAGSGTETDAALQMLQVTIAQAEAGRAELKAGISELSRTNAQINGTLVASGTSTGVTSRQSVDVQLSSVMDQLQSTLEGLMISYEQLASSRKIVEKQVGLYERLLSVQMDLYEQGLATAAEVNSASADLNSTKASLSSLDSSMSQIASAIGSQTGYTTDTVPEIGGVPDPDTAYVEDADLEADIVKAAGSNSVVKAAGLSDGTTAGNDLRDRSYNEAMGKLTAKMNELYADMKEKALLYESSMTTSERAERSLSSAETMYSLGMLSAAEYEAQILSYTSYKVSAELAKLNLTLSINNYKWALSGVVSLD